VARVVTCPLGRGHQLLEGRVLIRREKDPRSFRLLNAAPPSFDPACLACCCEGFHLRSVEKADLAVRRIHRLELARPPHIRDPPWG
jgi:hypothetical protein